MWLSETLSMTIKKERTIKRIYVDPTGWVHATRISNFDWKNTYKPIEHFTKNGEMAPADWYRQGNIEYNGKYVTTIEYD